MLVVNHCEDTQVSGSLVNASFQTLSGSTLEGIQ